MVVGEGLAPLLAGLRLAEGARKAVSAGVTRAMAYNVLAVAAALAGIVNPLVAAVAMPVSSAVAVWGARRVESHARQRVEGNGWSLRLERPDGRAQSEVLAVEAAVPHAGAARAGG